MAKAKYQDPQGRHIRVYATLLNSPGYRVLGFAAKALFFDLRDKLNGTNNGNINATLAEMKHKGWNSSATLAKALYELRAMGFIAVTVEGGLKQRKRTPSLYRFTDLPVLEHPKIGIQAITATNDYLQYQTVRDAERALEEKFSELKAEGKKKQLTKKNLPVQNLNCASSKNELEGGFSSSKSELVANLSVQNMNTAKKSRITPTPA
jgi:hypothetical protein